MSYPHAILMSMVVDPHESTFVGRAAELEALRGALARVREGGPETILLGGEAGGGKTRLITEFTHDVRTRVLCGECLELGSDGLPYAPFAAILRELVRELGVERVRSQIPGGPGELARLLPGLGDPPPAGEESRARLYEQILTLFERVAEEEPLVLVVEDAHWAERSTRDLILFLTRNLTIGRVLLVLTYRSDELHRTHPLRPLLAGLARDRRTTRVEVPALTRAEVAELATSLLGHELSPAFIDDLYERSAGNPLFLEALIECGGAADSELPESLRDLVLAQITRLPEPTQDVLSTMAGSPGQVTHALLTRVSGLDDARLTDALRPAVAANVLVVNEDGYAFRHALIREAVHAEALPGEHARLHKRFAEAIEAEPELVPEPRTAAELAHHWHAAKEHGKALLTAWQAAERARERLAYAEELRMLERVLDLWDQVPDAERLIGADCVRPLELAAKAARDSADSARAIALATAALRQIDVHVQRERAAVLLELRAKALSQEWSDRSIDDLRSAVALFDDDMSPGIRAMVLSTLAQHLWLQPSEAEASAYASEALRLARLAGDPGSEAHALITYAHRPEGIGAPPTARADLEHARKLAYQAGRHDQVIRASINETHLLEGLGEHEEAVKVAREGIERAAEFGLARTLGTFLTLNLAEPLISLGRWDEADEVLDAALALIPPAAHRFLLLTYRGRLAVNRGDVAGGREAVRVIQAIRGDRYYRAQERLPQLRLRLMLALAEGAPRAALEESLRGLSDPRSQRSPRYSWPLVVLAAGAIRVLNEAAPEAEPARMAYADLSAIADRLEIAGPVETADELTWRAESLLIEGDERAALDAWAAAHRAWAALNRPFEQAAAATRIVDVALRLGEREQAERHLREAVPITERLRAMPLRRELEELAQRGRLSATGEPAAPPAQTDLGLTPRERDVLALVASGRSNRQIAAELFISAKTASVHVSNILGKLGASSRGEAAATAHRLHLFD